MSFFLLSWRSMCIIAVRQDGNGFRGMTTGASAAKRLILVTGGARSGKSALAEAMAQDLAQEKIQQSALVYLATAQPWGAEMQARIRRHQKARADAGWRLVETGPDRPLVAALAETDAQDGVRLLDCLTLWLSSVIEGGDDAVGAALDDLEQALRRARGPVVVVTNELGLGMVPDHALARRFRDWHGVMNQRIARIADEVWMAVSGLPLQLK